MDAEMRAAAADIARRHRLEVKLEQIWYFPPSPFAQGAGRFGARGAEQAGYAHMDIVSGAGHDACYVSRVAPTAMIFVPCKDGISHNEIEDADKADIGAGCPDPPAGDGRKSEFVKAGVVKSGVVSTATAALVATVAGVGGTLPVVLAAADAVGATPAQASSWVTGLAIATALSALWLSVRYRMPIITAWSTPGAALIASTSGVPGIGAAVGAFVLAAVLILLTAAIRPLGRLIERIPASIARPCWQASCCASSSPWSNMCPAAPVMVLSLVALFLVARILMPTLASLIVLVAGALLAVGLGLVKPIPALGCRDPS